MVFAILGRCLELVGAEASGLSFLSKKGTFFDLPAKPNEVRQKGNAERVVRSGWEPGFRARVKAIAIANEVAKILFSELCPGSEATCEVLPRPVLVAEGGGWICSSPGCHDLHEPDPSYRHLTDSELADLRQPTSSVEVWGSADFVGESFFSEPARRLRPI